MALPNFIKVICNVKTVEELAEKYAKLYDDLPDFKPLFNLEEVDNDNTRSSKRYD